MNDSIKTLYTVVHIDYIQFEVIVSHALSLFRLSDHMKFQSNPCLF